MVDGQFSFIIDDMSLGQGVGHRDRGIEGSTWHIQRGENEILHELRKRMTVDILGDKACNHQAEIAISKEFAGFSDKRTQWQLLAHKNFQPLWITPIL